jgi:hypothetical protein
MNFIGDMMTRQDADTLLELLTEDFMSDETNRMALAAIRAQPLAADEHIKGVTDLIIGSASRSNFGRELVGALLLRMQMDAEGDDPITSADRPF